MDKLEKEYTFHEGPSMGRWGKAPRKGYILIPKKPTKRKRKMFIKEIDISKKKFRTEYNIEAKVNVKCTNPFPTKCVKSWTHDKKGYILSNYMDNIKWNDVPKKYEKKAVQGIAKQLQHIHKCGFSQGDLASKNLLVDKKGNTSIIDFEDAHPVNKNKMERDWDAFRSTFYQNGRRLYNYAQHAAPNDGYVLELDEVQQGESTRGKAFVLVVHGKRVGRVFATKRKSGKWKNWVYAANVVVYPKYRGRGMCSKMMQLLSQVVMASIYLEVYRKNGAAIACYEKAKFKKDTKNCTKHKLIMIRNRGSHSLDKSRPRPIM